MTMDVLSSPQQLPKCGQRGVVAYAFCRRMDTMANADLCDQTDKWSHLRESLSSVMMSPELNSISGMLTDVSQNMRNLPHHE